MKKGKLNLTKQSLITIIVILILGVGGLMYYSNSKGSKKSIFKKEEDKITIKENEVAKIEFEDYKTDNFTMKIPKGWKVDTIGDYIHYTIKAYNPNNPTYQFFINLKTEGYNKSEDAKAWQKKYYPNSIFAKNPVISKKTTEGFYKIFNELGPLNNTSTFKFPTLTDFNVIENLGAATLGGDVLRATFKDEDGNDAEGLFTAYVYDAGPYYVNENIMSGKQIDIYYLNVYDAIFITAPKDELIEWQDTLNTISSSLEFTDSFMNGFNQAQDAVMKTFQNVRSICNQISNGIMDSWEKRSKSYDIMSQKQSDAILGYERVYNTETGDIYKAYNGFTDDYKGDKYQVINDDMYTSKTSGYIEAYEK